MARRLTDRPRTEGEKAHHYIEMLSEHGSGLPNTNVLSRLIILGLLHRIGRQNPKEARFLFNNIKFLTGFETLLGTSTETHWPDDVVKVLTAKLKIITSSKVPGEDHDWYVLSDQRKLLIELYKEYPIVKSHAGRQYQNWLAKHSKEAHEKLSAISCFCEYRTSFDGIDQADLKQCNGKAGLIHLLLSHMHQTTPEAIRKRLSHPISS